MTKAEARQRIEKLKTEINHHRYLYHVKNISSISESVLDSLKKELFDLENTYPDLITPDSPTQRVAGEVAEGFVAVKHSIRMLSLNDAFTIHDIEDWEERMKRFLPKETFKYFCELKIDGFAITLIYKNGILVQGITRGNGFEGEDITANIKTVEAIPLRLELSDDIQSLRPELIARIKKNIEKGEIEIRGEIYMDRSEFDRINKEREKSGEQKYANPRNLAAGTMRQLDARLVASRRLKCIAYDIVTDLGFVAHSETHEVAHALGFNTVGAERQVNSVEEIITYYDEWKKHRDSLAFNIDGLVILVDDLAQQSRLGIVGKAPRYAIALKFPAEQVTTVIEDVIFQVGRTGVVTPVAVLRPVEVDGSMVSRATLHNADEIERLDVRVGDTVILQKAGDIIPEIVEILPALRPKDTKKFHFIKKCPECKNSLIQKEGEVAWRCPNPACPAQLKTWISYVAGKTVFDIEDLGPETVDQLFEEGLVTSLEDLYHLKKSDLLTLEGFADKAADNLISSIEKSKKVPFHKLLLALSIPQVGDQTARLLANNFKNLEALINTSSHDLEILKDIGPVVAKQIFEWFHDESNLEFLNALLRAGVQIIYPERVVGGPLSGKKFLITGTLDTMSRVEAQEKIRSLGGEILSAVSKNLSYLIVGSDPGSKVTKAEELNIPILTEEELIRLLTKK